MSKPYIVEIRDTSGNLIHLLENAFDIELEEAVNTPIRVTFSLPATDPKLYYVTKANEIWARDTEADEVLAVTKLLIQEDEH